MMLTTGAAGDNSMLDFEGMAVAAQQVLRQEMADATQQQRPSVAAAAGTSTQAVAVTVNNPHIAADQVKPGESLLKSNAASAVTYYVYDQAAAASTDHVTGDQVTGGDQITGEHVMVGNTAGKNVLTVDNDTEAAVVHLTDNLVDEMEYNTQFINLDLPSGSAVVKVEDSGALTVVNNFDTEFSTKELTPATEENPTEQQQFDPSQYEQILHNHEDTPKVRTLLNEEDGEEEGAGEEEEEEGVVFEEMMGAEPMQQYIIYNNKPVETVAVANAGEEM